LTEKPGGCEAMPGLSVASWDSARPLVATAPRNWENAWPRTTSLLIAWKLNWIGAAAVVPSQ
jgi:hypothetical protein